MQNIKYPVNFQFKISTFSNDFTATDADGQTIAYVRQKMFKLKEDIQVFNDSSKTQLNYSIKADSWLDFSAAYAFFDADGNQFGKIVRKGWRSLWKAQYEIIDQHQNKQYTITEENAWVKIIDGFLSEIPVLGMFSGYFCNPAYLLIDTNGNTVVKLSKLASFFGRNFQLTQIGDLDSDDDDRIMLGLMMMILLERTRG